MITASEKVRELPVPPVAFGIGAFLVLSLLLYFSMRIGKD